MIYKEIISQRDFGFVVSYNMKKKVWLVYDFTGKLRGN